MTMVRVKPPKITCLKEVSVGNSSMTVIPVALKNGTEAPMQKFKFPFKNLIDQEVDVEFSFMKTSAAFNFFDEDNQLQPYTESQRASPIEFSVSPNVIRVGPST